MNYIEYWLSQRKLGNVSVFSVPLSYLVLLGWIQFAHTRDWRAPSNLPDGFGWVQFTHAAGETV